MRKTVWLPALIALMLGAAACGGGSASPSAAAGSPSATAAERPPSTAKLTIVSPKNGEVIRGSTVDVRVRLTGARIVSVTSTVLKPNEGHLHLILDDQLISMTSGTSTAIPGVAPGHHLLKVEFVANDHGPFFPNVVAVASFDVQG